MEKRGQGRFGWDPGKLSQGDVYHASPYFPPRAERKPRHLGSELPPALTPQTLDKTQVSGPLAPPALTHQTSLPSQNWDKTQVVLKSKPPSSFQHAEARQRKTGPPIRPH